MRKITGQQISLFFLMLGIILVLGIGTAYGLLGILPLGDFRGVTIVIGAVVFIFLWAFAVYRLFLHFMPLQEGELAEGSREVFAAQVDTLFLPLAVLRPDPRPFPVGAADAAGVSGLRRADGCQHLQRRGVARPAAHRVRCQLHHRP